MDDVETRYYVPVTVREQPGVLAPITRSPGDHDLTIAAASQTEANAHDQSAELVMRASSFLRVEG